MLHPSLNGAPVRRSNRPLTQFVCHHLDRFMSGHADNGRIENCNTAVECSLGSKERIFSAFLYETELLNLVLDKNDQPVYLKISIGDRFAFGGLPSKAVIERLNGILDNLGIHGLIPEKIRIHKDRDEGIFYLGNGDSKVAVGQKYARNIVISSDPDNLCIESTDMALNCD